MSAALPSHRMKSTLLSARLKERIARHGPISVVDYMEACLADKHAGYYPSRQPIGADEDFITAPEVSQIFGELIGLWAIAVWQSMGMPKPVVVAELGPGRGTLMADALRAWRSVPAFGDSVTVALIETSPVLREVQRTALHGAEIPIRWHDRLEAAAPGPLIVVANEFLDALPVRQLIWRGHVWHERCVRIAATGNLAFGDGAPVENEGLRRLAGALDVPDGSVLEIRPGVPALMVALEGRAKTDPLAVLFIDYGHEETSCGDTLQAVSRHRYADPLSAPGDADLTAHVDFAALRDSARAHGLVPYGPMPQGPFLLRLGLEARRDRLCANATEAQRQDIAAGVTRLLDPTAMGVLFKAMAVTSQGLAPPPPFGEI
jgi:NADH dehydrogenase [ubiquinone] 1 alpha subcomplex assembly factor 7